MSENKTEATNQEVPATEEAPKPTLSAGLFKQFTLGSTLQQGDVGNVMNNLKQSPMDYEKAYQGSTKNASISPEDLSKIEVKKGAFQRMVNKLSHQKNPPRDPKAVAAKIGREELGQKEMTRRAEEGKKEAHKSEEDTHDLDKAVQISGPSRKIGVTPKTIAAAYAKKSATDAEIFASVPEDTRQSVLSELDRRIEEARKSSNETEAQRIEKAKDKAKKAWEQHS